MKGFIEVFYTELINYSAPTTKIKEAQGEKK